MKYFIFFVLLSVNALAANRYVWSGATGTGTGVDWSNAWLGLNFADGSRPQDGIHAGDTVWIAGGTYGKININDMKGTASNRIYFYRVRSTNSIPVAAAGWQPEFDSQVVVTGISGSWDPAYGSYVTIDGQVPYRGIVVTNTSLDETYAVDLAYAYPPGSKGAEYVELFNLDIGGISTLNAYATGETRSVSAKADAPTRGLHVAYCKLHGASTLVLTIQQVDMIFEHNILYENTVSNTDTWHPNVWNAPGGNSNVTVRYNDISEFQTEGIMFENGPANMYWYIYGNVWRNRGGAEHFEYARILEPQKVGHGPVFVFNNTFFNMPWGIVQSTVDANTGAIGYWVQGCMSMNNIFFMVSDTPTAYGFNQGFDDYNLSDIQMTHAHDVSWATSNIFVSIGTDFHIKPYVLTNFPADKGSFFSTNGGNEAYALDMDGSIRGAGNGLFDIGAYEALDDWGIQISGAGLDYFNVPLRPLGQVGGFTLYAQSTISRPYSTSPLIGSGVVAQVMTALAPTNHYTWQIYYYSNLTSRLYGYESTNAPATPDLVTSWTAIDTNNNPAPVVTKLPTHVSLMIP